MISYIRLAISEKSKNVLFDLIDVTSNNSANIHNRLVFIFLVFYRLHASPEHFFWQKKKRKYTMHSSGKKNHHVYNRRSTFIMSKITMWSPDGRRWQWNETKITLNKLIVEPTTKSPKSTILVNRYINIVKHNNIIIATKYISVAIDVWIFSIISVFFNIK